MDAYAKRYGVTGEDWEDFHYLLSALDGVFVEHWRTKGGTGGETAEETRDGES